MKRDAMQRGVVWLSPALRAFDFLYGPSATGSCYYYGAGGVRSLGSCLLFDGVQQGDVFGRLEGRPVQPLPPVSAPWFATPGPPSRTYGNFVYAVGTGVGTPDQDLGDADRELPQMATGAFSETGCNSSAPLPPC